MILAVLSIFTVLPAMHVLPTNKTPPETTLNPIPPPPPKLGLVRSWGGGYRYWTNTK